jgi:aldehyde:ferredoxin oxidoreductase
MLDEYYSLHGWDSETGWQTKETLVSLGLTDVADRLKAAGRLP